MNHELYMNRCLELAELGLANASPNPSVGAVLVHNDKIIGEGYTAPYGGPHGEVNCIADAKKEFSVLPSNSILYVSLEPCSHVGKTPPCTDLIIREKISTVVISSPDSNPLVKGQGITKLEKAGIRVITGILNERSRELNKRFFTFHEKKRPYVILKWAETKQGFFAPSTTKQFWITNSNTKALVHQWRSQEMAILVGEKTIAIDNPMLNTRLVEGKSPLRIIINTEHELSLDSHVISDKLPTLIFTKFGSVKKGVKEYFKLKDNQAIIPQLMDELYKRNINSLIVEGGAYTIQQFINSKIWDEARILIGEKELSDGILSPEIEGTIKDKYFVNHDLVKVLKPKL